MWLGIGSLFTFFIAYILVLSWADYSYVQPASSVAYGVVALLGYLVLREPITLDPLGWDRYHLRRRVYRGAHAAPHDGALTVFREAVFYLLIVVAGTSGELVRHARDEDDRRGHGFPSDVTRSRDFPGDESGMDVDWDWTDGARFFCAAWNAFP